MALTDPFRTTYAGSRQAGLALGGGLQTAASAIAAKVKEQQDRQRSMEMLKQFGMMMGGQSGQPTPSGISTPGGPQVSGEQGVGGKVSDTAPAQFSYVATPSIDASGKMSMSFTPKENPDYEVWKKAKEKEIDYKAKIKQSELTAIHNFDLVGGVMKDYVDTLTSAYGEGSAGWKGAGFKARLAEKGWLPPEHAAKFGEGAAAIGKSEELILKSFPMFTQQIGKEGSVRLMEKVLERIRVTYPTVDTAPENLEPLLRNTMLSLYRVTRAISTLPEDDIINLTKKAGESEASHTQRLDLFADRLARLSTPIELSEKENKIVDNKMDIIMKKANKHLSKKYGIEIGTVRGDVGDQYEYIGGYPKRERSWRKVK